MSMTSTWDVRAPRQAKFLRRLIGNLSPRSDLDLVGYGFTAMREHAEPTSRTWRIFFCTAASERVLEL